MMADHGTNRYILYKKRRTKQAKPTKGSGTAAYTPMYKNEQIKTAGQIRSNNTAMYSMMDKGGTAKCGCSGSKLKSGRSIGILYK